LEAYNSEIVRISIPFSSLIKGNYLRAFSINSDLELSIKTLDVNTMGAFENFGPDITSLKTTPRKLKVHGSYATILLDVVAFSINEIDSSVF
jgi:hypothetical protein